MAFIISIIFMVLLKRLKYLITISTIKIPASGTNKRSCGSCGSRQRCAETGARILADIPSSTCTVKTEPESNTRNTGFQGCTTRIITSCK